MATSDEMYHSDGTYKNIPVLYKFRSWTNELHKRILTKGEIYLANPNSFNDPFDCGVCFRPSYTRKDARRIGNEIVNIDFAHLSRKQRRQRAAELYKQKNYANAAVIKKVYDDVIRTKYGVFSLSEGYDNLLLWSHYSESHQGFCVGLNCESIVNYAYIADDNPTPIVLLIDKVRYYDEWPDLEYHMIPRSCNRQTTEESIFELTQPLLAKAKDWSYEREWRIMSTSTTNFSVTLASDAISAVYLGAKIPHKDAEEIKLICTEKHPSASLYQAIIPPRQFRLEFQRIK